VQTAESTRNFCISANGLTVLEADRQAGDGFRRTIFDGADEE
jgi:hypothetical protein